MIAMSGCSARIRAAARSPSSVWVGGIRMSVTTRSGLVPRDEGEQRLGVVDRGDHLVPGPLEDPDQPLAQQRGVLGEHDPQAGHSILTSVGPPGGLVTRSVATERVEPDRQPGQPGAGTARGGAADPVVLHRQHERRRRAASACTPARRAPACRATLVSASLTTKYAACSTGAGSRSGEPDVDGDRHRGPVGQLVHGGGEAVVDQHPAGGCRGWCCAARPAPPRPGGARPARRPAPGPPATSSSARPSVIVSATSRCWTPSCRSRSIRRRSVSKASTRSTRERRRSATVRGQLGLARVEQQPGERRLGDRRQRHGVRRDHGQRQPDQRSRARPRRRGRRASRAPSCRRSSDSARGEQHHAPAP